MQIETKDFETKAKRCESDLEKVERQRQSLERKLRNVNQERDTIASLNMQLRAELKKVQQKLTDLGLQHEAAIELAECLSESQKKRHHEKETLEIKLKEVENELSLIKFQVSNSNYNSTYSLVDTHIKKDHIQ